jgi:hypothetical protein
MRTDLAAWLARKHPRINVHRSGDITVIGLNRGGRYICRGISDIECESAIMGWRNLYALWIRELRQWLSNDYKEREELSNYAAAVIKRGDTLRAWIKTW